LEKIVFLFGGYRSDNCFNRKKQILDKTESIQQLRNSDKNAFNELFRQFYKPLCRFAYTILHCSQSSEEVVQEVFLKLWENRIKMNANVHIDSYLFVAVKNTSLNYLKFHQIRQKYEEEQVESAETPNNFDEKAFISHLQKAIAKLPEQCRMIYHLKNFEGLTHSEIAEYMEISEKTVENQVHIALVKLREMLHQYKNDFYIEKK
jgi:RNA polymerase sigma-70 factor (ECF subfamily)